MCINMLLFAIFLLGCEKVREKSIYKNTKIITNYFVYIMHVYN